MSQPKSNQGAGKGDKPRPIDRKKYEDNYDRIFNKKITDGFGGEWSRCERKDCALEVVHPGKVQCNLCENKKPL